MNKIIETIILYLGYLLIVGGFAYGVLWLYQKLWDLLSDLFKFKRAFIAYAYWKYHSNPKIIKGEYQWNPEEPTVEQVKEVEKDIYK